MVAGGRQAPAEGFTQGAHADLREELVQRLGVPAVPSRHGLGEAPVVAAGGGPKDGRGRQHQERAQVGG